MGFFRIWLACLIGILSLTSWAGEFVWFGHDEDPLPPLGEENPLFSSIGNVAPVSPNSIPSQYFTDAPDQNGGFLTIAMDDFTVPEGERWAIERIEVRGNYTPNGGPADSINLFIIEAEESGTTPRTTDILNGSAEGVRLSAQNLAYQDLDSGDFSVALPQTLFLESGTYFFGAQAVLAGADGQWLWTESSSKPDSGIPLGAASVWMENFQIFAPPACTNAWGQRIATCNVTDPQDTSPPEPDMAFALFGNGGVVGLDYETPPSISTSEAGDEDSFSVRLATVPSAAVTLRLTSLFPDEALLAREDSDPAISLDVAFDASTWDQYRSIRVIGQDDPFVDPAGVILISTAVTSDDSAYAALFPQDLPGVNRDDACDVYRHDGSVGSSAEGPSKSAGGQWIAYHSTADPVGTNGDGNSEIFLYNSTTGIIQQITQTTDRQSFGAKISRDGLLVAFTSNADLSGENAAGQDEVFRFNQMDQSFTQLTESTVSNGTRLSDLSGDGLTAAIISPSNWTGNNGDGSDEAFLLFTESSTYQQLSTGGDHPISDPVYEFVLDKDAEKAAYSRGPKSPGHLYLWRDPAVGGTLLRNGGHQALTISSDGTYVAFVSSDNVDGSNSEGNPEAFLFEGDENSGSYAAVTATIDAVVDSVTINQEGLIALVTNADYLGNNSDRGNELYLTQRNSNLFTQLTQFTNTIVTRARIEGVELGETANQISYSFNRDLTQRIYLSGVRPTFYTSLPAWRVDNLMVLQLLPLLCGEAPDP